MQNYDIICQLGIGCSANVYLMRNRVNGELRAGKKMLLSDIRGNGSLGRDGEDLVKKEGSILETLAHPNIIPCYHSFVEDCSFYIVMEYMDGGDLSFLISHFQQRGELIPEKVIVSILKQCAMGIHQIHSHSFIHRDIKPPNIYLNSKGEVKLGDFGIAERLLPSHYLRGQAGTLRYMAPEVVQGNEYDHSADIWALGCVIGELMQRKPLFNENEDSKGVSTTSGQGNLITSFFSGLYSTDLCHLVSSMLSQKGNQRPTIQSILAHPLLSGFRNEKEILSILCEKLAIEKAFLLIPTSLPPQPPSLVNCYALRESFLSDCEFLIRNAQGLLSVVTELIQNKHSGIDT